MCAGPVGQFACGSRPLAVQPRPPAGRASLTPRMCLGHLCVSQACRCAGKIPAYGFQGIKTQAPLAAREKASCTTRLLMCFSSLESKLILTLGDPQWMLYVEASGDCSLLLATENSEASRSPGGSRLWLWFFPVTRARRPVLTSAGQSGLPTACPAILHMRTVGAASNISGCVGAWVALCWQGAPG